MAMRRHTRAYRCPVCGGADGDPRGQGKRCSGFTSADGEWVHCSREEHAGGLEQEDGGTYAHRLHGECKCGTSHGPGKERTGREPEATYDYRDESGRLLFQVVRLPGKQFRQRRPSGDGWIWQLGDTRRVPYRLPEIIHADPARTVYIVEGEKDADALVARGQLATCNPGGAGKWHFVAAAAAKALAGRAVVVIADLDDVGRQHARKVAAALQNKATSVRVLELPQKDASDFFDAGGDVAELERIAAAAPTWTPSDDEDDDAERAAIDAEADLVGQGSGLGAGESGPRIEIIDGACIFDPLPPIPWICEPLCFAPGAPAMFAGYGYSAKTMAAQSLALSVAAGFPAWGKFAVRQGRVVHLDYEQGRRLTLERYARMSRAYRLTREHLAGSIAIGVLPSMYLDAEQAEDELARLCDGAALAIVDSFRACAPSVDENSSDVRIVLDKMNRVSDRTGCMFLVIHHARKTQQGVAKDDAKMSVRGSGAIFDACASVLVFQAEKGEPTMVTHEKARISGTVAEDFSLEVSDVPSPEDFSIGAPEHDPRWGLRVEAARADDTRQQVAEKSFAETCERVKAFVRANPRTSTAEIRARVGGRVANVTAALGALQRQGSIAKFGSSGTKAEWMISTGTNGTNGASE